jgi:hypothetical protein
VVVGGLVQFAGIEEGVVEVKEVFLSVTFLLSLVLFVVYHFLILVFMGRSPCVGGVFFCLGPGVGAGSVIILWCSLEGHDPVGDGVNLCP